MGEAWPCRRTSGAVEEQGDAKIFLRVCPHPVTIVRMSPLLLTTAAVLAEERDPIWEAMLASPVVEDDLSQDEQAAFEEGMADIRAGRVVSHNNKQKMMMLGKVVIPQGTPQ